MCLEEVPNHLIGIEIAAHPTDERREQDVLRNTAAGHTRNLTNGRQYLPGL